MCGIVGVIGRENAFSLVIEGMNKISYRGKDGYGLYDGKECFYSDKLFFEETKCNTAIGHCLHAVVDKIKQPFIDKGIFAVNCEIYNWGELCKKFNLTAINDAELFFKLLEEFGVEKTLELVDGDYAGAYLSSNELYLFRDRVGVKPIWYSLENGFGFSSERKVLRALNYENVFELNPRELLIYDTEKKYLQFVNLDFYDFKESCKDYKELKKELGGCLVDSIARRIPDANLGLLFSGGVDSSFIAMVFKKLNVDFSCYVCVVSGFEKEAEDLIYAKKVADNLGLNLKIIEVNLDEIEEELPNICNLIESNDVTKISVSIPFYFACRRASGDGVKVIFSGLGADDLFGGYGRIVKGLDINKECYNSLLNLYERDLYRDDVITMYNKIELRVPYLDKNVISYSLFLDKKYKLNENNDKLILRDIAFDYGLDREFSYRKKKATQYGGNFVKALDKLSKRSGFNNKSKYLASLYNESNVKLASLFSSGKDSCYAMYIMKKQNYDIKCLITINSRNKDSYMYHTPNVHVAEMQADALGLPIIMQDSSGEKEKELDDMKEALIKAKNKYKIEGIVCGAIFSNYQRDRIRKITEELGLKLFTPLWHKNQETLLKELLANNFEVIISSIAADGLNKNWLGSRITIKEIKGLTKLNKEFGINPAGEGGEFESLVLDCPMFRKKLFVEDSEIIMDSEYSGIYKIKKIKLLDK